VFEIDEVSKRVWKRFDQIPIKNDLFEVDERIPSDSFNALDGVVGKVENGESGKMSNSRRNGRKVLIELKAKG